MLLSLVDRGDILEKLENNGDSDGSWCITPGTIYQILYLVTLVAHLYQHFLQLILSTDSIQLGGNSGSDTGFVLIVIPQW